MDDVDRFLILTSINPPTRTLDRARELQPGWGRIVVGDAKSPDEWVHEGTEFLSLDRQAGLPFELSPQLPVGHYARKNLGYLQAMARGASVIAETDDDNVPYDDFLATSEVVVVARPVEEVGWVNVYRCFTDDRIWPRGLPLQHVNGSMATPPRLGEAAPHRCLVQQFLADGDPDVDAVYRLTVERTTRFRRELPIVLQRDAWCPFNSQNTVWHPGAFHLLYLPSTATFRMTDIWRSLVAQACLHAMGEFLAFGPATVFQERNEHDLMRDFESELSGYLGNQRLVDALAALPLDGADPHADLRTCYAALHELGFVEELELRLVDAWIEDVRALGH